MKKILIVIIAVASILLLGSLLVLLMQLGGSGSDAPEANTDSGKPTSESVAGGNNGVGGKPVTARSGSSPDSDKETNELEEGVSGLAGVRYVEIAEGASITSVAQAQNLVQEQASQLGINTPSALEVVDNSDDGLGNVYYQIEQLYSDIPVYGANALLEVSNGEAEILSGIWEENIDLDTEPSYTAEESLALAVEGLNSTQEPVLRILDEPALVVYISNVGAHLAWKMKARVFEAGDAEAFVIDAHSPDFLLRVSLERH